LFLRYRRWFVRQQVFRFLVVPIQSSSIRRHSLQARFNILKPQKAFQTIVCKLVSAGLASRSWFRIIGAGPAGPGGAARPRTRA